MEVGPVEKLWVRTPPTLAGLRPRPSRIARFSHQFQKEMVVTTPIRLAVYGTLKSTHPNHNTLGQDAKVIARNIRIPGFTLYDVGNGWYPGAIRDPDGFGVEVEIVEVPASKLARIDEYEGYTGEDNSLFMREIVQLPNGEDALMYIFNRPVDNKPDAFYQAIPSGRWEDASNENSHVLS